MNKRNSRYSEIIDLPHHRAEYRPHMPVASRAAQFAPFAALTGFEDMVEYTTELQSRQRKRDLDQNKIEILDRKLYILTKTLSEKPSIEVTYFDNSVNRVGGGYVSYVGNILKIKTNPIKLVMQDGKCILGIDIVEINGEVFQKYNLD